MGLDCSHNCWHGPYSRFNRFREALAEAAGYGELEEYDGYGRGRKQFPDGELKPFFEHSDCDGYIPVEQQEPMRLALLELYDKLDTGWRPELVQFCQGLADATAAKEPVLFH